MTIERMRDGWFAPTVNLVRHRIRAARRWTTSWAKAARSTPSYVMSNNFAFGGIASRRFLKRLPTLA